MPLSSSPTPLSNTISLGGTGGNPSFKVSNYNKTTTEATILYGTLNINSQFVASSKTIGAESKIFAALGSFIYLQINKIFSRTETPTIEFFNSFDSPDQQTKADGTPTGKKIEVPAAPFPSIICLAFIDNDGKIFDLRPAWVINVFSFLG